ncbi:CBP3-like protein [Hypsizygus marmoreus]|uniref:CBP3-like protein n=1 Tax=Hypsizygus marmoreus TaxID=39966 RepID=A0A369JBR3_HYPMA|nr:CBP3-like protein [Hypsizygus marmoreus]
MVARSLLIRHLRAHQVPLRLPYHATTRCFATKPQPPPRPPVVQKSWLTRKVESSPAAMNVFLKLTNALGYGSPKQLAGRRAFVLYEQVCAVRPDEDRAFWQDECHLPPTFQSWFTVTNLHIWLLTVRLRALPAPHGKFYTQALVDHFFLDIEDRIRAVLQPQSVPSTPYTFNSPFYINPNAPITQNESQTQPQKRRSRAPDRLVTRQMKIFKEQWAGMGLALDLGLVKGDMELAGAVWRNLLGARGAHGIAFPTPTPSPTSDTSSPPTPSPPTFRRAVNLVGGEVINVSKVDFEKEETRDDGSGVHDFAPEEADLYVRYPELMLDVVRYVRREIGRLEGVSDRDVMSGRVERVKFGAVRGP